MPFAEITPRVAHADLARYRVIDVREPHEFDGPLGAIEGAELIPLGCVAERADELADGRPLLFVCRSGKRSGVACEALQQRGIRDVTNLAGGMIAWNRAGLPLVRPEPATLAQLRDTIIAWLAQVSPLPEDAAVELVRERFDRQGLDYDAPSRAAIEDLTDFAAESLSQTNPADLALSLAFFRSALAAL